MTGGAVAAETSAVRIIGPVTGDTLIRIARWQGLRSAVTGFASQRFVRPRQRKDRPGAVVEAGFVPTGLAVTAPTVGTKRAFVRIVFTMAIDAAACRIEKPQGRMAVTAQQGAMPTEQRKL